MLLLFYDHDDDDGVVVVIVAAAISQSIYRHGSFSCWKKHCLCENDWKNVIEFSCVWAYCPRCSEEREQTWVKSTKSCYDIAYSNTLCVRPLYKF